MALMTVTKDPNPSAPLDDLSPTFPRKRPGWSARRTLNLIVTSRHGSTTHMMESIPAPPVSDVIPSRTHR